MLENHQFEISNGLEAVELDKTFLPDVVTMDVTMLGMNGIEAVKEIIWDFQALKS